jgi:uncharacterized protein
MNTELHKTIAHQFFDRFTASDLDGALATMTDDATWWIIGKPERIPSSGMHDKASIARVFRSMLARMPSGLAMRVKNAVAEGDQVALEVESHGDLANSRLYRQSYHFLMVFCDGKIAAVREYLDTQHVFEVWFAPQSVGLGPAKSSLGS